MKPRTAKINRETKETSIKTAVNLDGSRQDFSADWD